MYLKYYKIHERLGLLGLICILAPLAVSILGKLLFKTDIIELYQAEYQIVTVVSLVISGLLFVISMGYYYQIIDVFTKVTTVTKRQKWILIFTHIMSIVAMMLYTIQIAFSWNLFIAQFLFMSSIMIRQVCGFRDIDGDMEEHCVELDVELRKIGYEALSEEEKAEFTVGMK